MEKHSARHEGLLRNTWATKAAATEAVQRRPYCVILF